MSAFRAHSLRSKITVMLGLMLAWAFASPVSVYASDKKKTTTTPATTDQPAEIVDLSKIDISKLVWPQPPSIPRVRYTAYFAGMKIDRTPARKLSPRRPGWIGWLAASRSRTLNPRISPSSFW